MKLYFEWLWEEKEDTFREFDYKYGFELEEAYNKEPQYNLTLLIKGKNYLFDFKNMTQMNLANETIRRVKRVEITKEIYNLKLNSNKKKEKKH
jgi:hypothetical protein